MTQPIARVVTWSTRKVAGGFEFRAVSFDHGVAETVHAAGVLPTRERAQAHAKRWVRYLKAQQRAAA